ncbi:MAG TPA: V-type ATP synthase subunit F [Gammaproteobacteria bacterium]
MNEVVYIGDALGAAGFRLAGVTTRVAGDDDAHELVRAARRQAHLVLVSTRVATALPPAALETYREALSPQFLVLPDVADGTPPADPLAGILAQLGVEA